MKKVLFIDNGNLLRSPIAKALYNTLKIDDSVAESYGTLVEKQGREGKKLHVFPEIQTSIDEMKKQGMNLENEICKQIQHEHVTGGEKLIVMAEDYIPPWLEKYDYEFWDIQNSIVITPKVMQEVIDLLKKKIEILIHD